MVLQEPPFTWYCKVDPGGQGVPLGAVIDPPEGMPPIVLQVLFTIETLSGAGPLRSGQQDGVFNVYEALTVQLEASVTVTVYIPAGRSVLSSVVAGPSLQAKVYGAVPEVIVRSIAPPERLAQVGCVKFSLTVGLSSTTIGWIKTALQLLLSVTVTRYVKLAGVIVTELVFAKLVLHEYEKPPGAASVTGVLAQTVPSSGVPEFSVTVMPPTGLGSMVRT